jgi:DNA-binding NtrC family response regulator
MSSKEGTRMICLVVDDEKDTRDVVMRTLSTQGFGVKDASNLYEALDVLKVPDPEPAHMMLLDWNLPGMPMENFLKQVREINPDLTVVLSTAAFRVESKARQLKLNWWLPKPILPEALIQLAATIAGQKQPGHSNRGQTA